MKELKDREYENALVWKIMQQSMDIDVLEDENIKLKHEVDKLRVERHKLEEEILELSQAKKLDVPTMTDPAAKGEM